MSRYRRPTIVLTSLVVLSSISTATSAAAGPSSAAGCGPSWTIVESPSPGATNLLNDVVAFSPTDAWAVGSKAFIEATSRPLILHWDGATWSEIPAPGYPGEENALQAVGGVAPNDVWAVGWHDGGNLAIHWDGSSWEIVPALASLGGLSGLVAFASDDVWAVGANVVRWDGRRWKLVKVDSPRKYLFDVDGISPSDILAVGYRDIDFPSYDITFSKHWDGEEWRDLKTPSGSTDAQLYGVTSLAPDDAWAVGDIGPVQPGRTPIAIQWNGSRWELPRGAMSEDPLQLRAVHGIAQDDVWAVGSQGFEQPDSLFQHWDGDDWSEVEAPPATLHGVTADPTGARQWAVGTSDPSATSTRILERCG
jgi:hypothetical protein